MHELDLGEDDEDRINLMRAIDRINDRHGRGAVTIASAGLGGQARRWTMRQELKTPDYTTRWSDLPRARA